MTDRLFREQHCAARNASIRIPAKTYLTTVLELDTWSGPIVDDGSPEPDYKRRAVLLATDMNEALRVQTDLIDGEPRMMAALFESFDFESEHRTVVLGFDFFRQQPSITIYTRPRRF